MSKKDVAFAKGRVQGIRESGWTCGDCGNLYDASADYCPNRLLDEAVAVSLREETNYLARKRSAASTDKAGTAFGFRTAHRTPEGKVVIVGPFDSREEAEKAAAGQPIVQLPEASSSWATEAMELRRHLVDCPCEHGACCPWMGDCTCQCLCDFIARIEDRVRDEYAPSENDANEGYRTGYATAVAEYLANHDNDAAYKLGYEQALRDNEIKAQADQGETSATVDEAVSDVNGDNDVTP